LYGEGELMLAGGLKNACEAASLRSKQQPAIPYTADAGRNARRVRPRYWFVTDRGLVAGESWVCPLPHQGDRQSQSRCYA